jgi:dihydroorotase
MGKTVILKNFRIVDEGVNVLGSVILENGIIREVIPGPGNYPDDSDVIPDKRLENYILGADFVIEGGEGTDKWGLTLLPALVDLHAHFRDPGYPEKENLESASLAAAAGGYGTVVCMANTNPAIDTIEAAAATRARAAAVDLIDLYPALSLSKGMAGKELSGITRLPAPGSPGTGVVRIVSEDGKDLADSALFSAALEEAKRAGVIVSVHCELESAESAAAKKAGKPRSGWSRIEEINGVQRAIELGKKAGCHIHIAHVSTAEAVELIRDARAELSIKNSNTDERAGFSLTCEVTPHHLFLTEKDAKKLGEETGGRVNPPLRGEADRDALIAAVADGIIDAIATDHAPHTARDKEGGAPGFTGLETAFSVCLTELVREDRLSLSRLAALMSGAPARILGLGDRGRIVPGYRADFFVVDTSAHWTVDPTLMKSRSRNSPYAGRDLRGRILMTLRQGRVVFESPEFAQ